MTFALAQLLTLLLFVASWYASGALISLAAWVPGPGALGRFVARTTLGLVAWMGGLFALCCVQGYRGWIVLSIAGGVFAALGIHALRRPRALAGYAWQSRARELGRDLLYMAPSVLVWLCACVRALERVIGWDDDVYHLALPKLYLASAGFRTVPFSVYSHWPHALELVYGVALMFADQVLAKLVHTLLLGLLLIAVYRLCRVHSTRWLASLACLLVVGNEVLLFEASIAYIDLGFALLFLIAVAYADEYLRTDQARYLDMCGLFCGAVAASKLSGLVAPICVSAALWFSHPRRFEPARTARIVCGVFVPCLLFASPWYVKSLLETGNPVYPFLFDRFGGPEWSGQLGRDLFAWQHGIGMGRSLRDYLALPYRVIVDGGRGYGRFDGALNHAWLAVVPIGVLGAIRDRSVRCYGASAWLYFVCWALSSQQSRFLLPALPLLVVAAALSVRAALAALPNERLRVWSGFALAAGVLALTLPTLKPFYVDAIERTARLWRDGPPPPAAAVPAGYAFVNASTPPNAKVMLINTNRGFFLEREHIADSFFEASQMNWLLHQASSAAELPAILQALGVTHIYLQQAKWGVHYPDWFADFLHDRQYAVPIYVCPHRLCTIYRLREP